MANRVLSSEVKEIIETTICDTTPFINTANAIVNEYLSNSGLSITILKQIELWLSAHLVAMRERQVTSEKLGDATTQYGGEFGLGLDFTQYGQQVKILDPTGTLTTIGKPKASLEVFV